MITKILAFIKLLNGFSVSEREFKDLIRTVAARNWHYLFELTIKKYDPTVNLDYSKSFKTKEFINEGRGAGILKPNRVLTGNNGKVFEKIFFNDSPGLKRNLFFKQIATEHINNQSIKYPAIKEINQGGKLTIILFEYIELKRIPKGEEYEILKATTYNMYQPQHKVSIGDEIHYDRFLIGKERLIETAVFSDHEIEKLQTVVKNSPVYFQHFDLKEDNVFVGHVIIDWDNCGNYHMGADLGVLLLSYFVFHEEEFFSQYKEEISHYYQQMKPAIPYDIFYITVLYHFLNLYHGYSSGEAHYQKIYPVVSDCKAKLKEIIL